MGLTSWTVNSAYICGDLMQVTVSSGLKVPVTWFFPRVAGETDAQFIARVKLTIVPFIANQAQGATDVTAQIYP